MRKSSTGRGEEETTRGVALPRPNGLEEEQPSIEVIQLTTHETGFDTGEDVALNMYMYYVEVEWMSCI